MTLILSEKSHANSLTPPLRMINPTEELRDGKGIEETLLVTLLETLPEILQDKTDEETNLQEDPIKQIRHSRMNQTSLRTTYENSACIQMTPILSAKSHANYLISSLRMMNPTEELREGKGIEETLLETLLGIIQDKTNEETNLQEDPIKQIRHSRMNVSYTKTTSGLTVE